MNPPDVARRTLRQLAVAALEAAVANGNFAAEIQSPGNWNVPPEKLVGDLAQPLIMVRTPSDSKQSEGKQEPNFKTSVTLELKAFAPGATSGGDAQDAAEILDGWIEDAILRDFGFNDFLNQVAAIETTTEVLADGEHHYGGVAKRILCETKEDFEPQPPPPFKIVFIVVDLQAPFDKSGDYPISPDAPPYTPPPAPRDIGPDGRVEGELEIILPE